MTKTVAFHTLGCKVNQYDSQAMLELLRAAGYRAVPFSADADVYVINTCTVTGTGDRKSMQTARRIRREHPDSALVLCGCLAQRKGEDLLRETGAALVLGTQHRARIAELLERALSSGTPLCAVDQLPPGTPYETLRVSTQEEHTRATMKIQEGCSNRCTYCIIPEVRGPIRSRTLEDIRMEAQALAEAGFRELVLTGIHLSSYGRDFTPRLELMDAIRCVHGIDGIGRIRLGSLEPTVATEAFAGAVAALPKVCPQFHLALQSGSDTVLHRMARRYNMDMYRTAVRNIRKAMPDAALTTDILTGFPGETEQEFRETCEAVRSIGFARIHVFPFSPREGTPAASMPGQLSREEKERRVRELIRIGAGTAAAYQNAWIGRESTVLLEERDSGGRWTGCTPEYLQVSVDADPTLSRGQLVSVRLDEIVPEGIRATLLSDEKQEDEIHE
ncbi:MAG: tRNA (N(6)-L-threonylcarbamoyladenosine(37)-C(2))-methylthiotransferase MtaB [Clostridia bacterium]|nr:tRNA (N(6)-L-threonylcarbamoyladenosine(37)-C(2))-methylthiotransferase MtaB [Clostridia bacterium]